MGTNKEPRTGGNRERGRKQGGAMNQLNSFAQQCQLLLDYLRVHGSCTTIEARQALDIIHPAGRVLDLRKAGEKIETVWTWDVTEQGKSHRVAKYLLANGGTHD